MRSLIPASCFLAMLLALWPPLSCAAGSCMALAEKQVLAPFAGQRDSMAWLLRSGCETAAQASASITPKTTAKREEPCRKQVLVPLYLNVCLYFRDVVCAEAFAPCWDWAREQFEHCRRGDEAWFAP